MIQRLRIKFICVLMTIITFMLAGILNMMYWSTGDTLETQSIGIMRTIAADPFHQEDFIALPENARLPHLVVKIDNFGNRTIINDGHFNWSEQNDLQVLVNAVLDTRQGNGILEDYRLRFLVIGDALGLTIVFADISTEVHMLQHMTKVCITIFLAAWSVFWAISILLSRWIVKPVATAWEQQREFVANASHELKTPLSVIMANAELLENEDSSEDVKHFSQNIMSVSYQMRGLVENMLEMARVDNGSLKMTFEPLDLSQLVSDAVLSFRLLYEEQAMELDSWIDEDITIQGSEQYLYQVLDVLLDNALKYATPKSVVTVCLTHNNRHCVLSVTSQGTPLSKEDRKRIFQRFYRADKARAMNGSYGLGLSIAKSIVEAHKGKIWVDSRENENIFFVQLPI